MNHCITVGQLTKGPFDLDVFMETCGDTMFPVSIVEKHVMKGL
jgi:hypothetical protein